jgi:hypothetical protein
VWNCNGRFIGFKFITVSDDCCQTDRSKSDMDSFQWTLVNQWTPPNFRKAVASKTLNTLGQQATQHLRLVNNGLMYFK